LAVHGASEEVEQHLAMGMKLVSAGQLSDALSHYHAAVGNVSTAIYQSCRLSRSLNLCNPPATLLQYTL
jgi:hypothetical protein